MTAPASTPNPHGWRCPDCRIFCIEGTLKHQHQNGEWVYTDNLRAFYQVLRWKAILAGSADAIDDLGPETPSPAKQPQESGADPEVKKKK